MNLTLIVKATEYCNAACVYCAVSDKDSKKEKMSLDTLRRLLERVGEHLAVDHRRKVHITWHGGEPALMGADFYRSVYLLAQEILGDEHARLAHSVQSNITLINAELADVFAQLGVKTVGTSYDYTPGLRGIGAGPDSHQYNTKFFEGLQYLRDRQISAGTIFVVTSHTIDKPVESMIFLGNLLGKELRGHFRLNHLYLDGEACKDINRGLATTPEQFGHF